jgi:DNA-binding beta-propeller fold protein YncE
MVGEVSWLWARAKKLRIAGLALLFVAVITQAGCSKGSKTITVTVSPKTATVKLQSTVQFAFVITPSSDTAGVKWYVNDTLGGNGTIGTIDTTGKYTAPISSSSSFSVTVKAISNTDTSKYDTATVTISTGATVTVFPTSTVTIAEGETYQFTDTVTNLVNANSPTTVDWYVDGVNGGSNAAGTIDTTGKYTAPASAATHVIKAQLQSDSSSYGTTNVTVVAPAAATLSDVFPCDSASSQLYGCFLPQGALFEDIYLYGSNFRSSSVVRANGSPVVTSYISTNILRARLEASDLAKADTSSGTGTLFIDVAQEGASGTTSTSSAIDVPVGRAAPSLISSKPDSVVQNGGTLSVAFDGGFYTDATSAEFNGISQSASVQNPRQLLVTVDSSNFANAGLFPVNVRNSGLSQIAGANLAVRPPITQSSSPTPLTVQPVHGTSPNAIAINLATGLAVVANTGSNSITLFDLTAAIPTAIGPYAVGKAPTGIAIDSLRDLAFVANSGDNSLQIIDLCANRTGEFCASPTPAAPPTIIATINYSTTSSGASSTAVLDAVQPYSVAINPLTARGLVVFQGSSYVDVLDYSTFAANVQSPDLTKIKVTRGQIQTTGSYPHISVEPRLNWAFVTPGGNGNGSIVDLGASGQEIVSLIAVPSSNGAVRKSGTVTITTTSSHNLVVGEYVTISGVNDSSFDGYFQTVTVPSSTTFTYTQSGSDVTSGNGTVSAAAPLATINVNKDVRGIAINPETEQALMCDPTSVSLTLMSLLDQTTSSISGVNGATARASDCAVNPLTDTAAIVDSVSNTFSVVDLQNSYIMSQFTIGRNPSAVAIDPVLNLAVAVNSTDATVSIIPLGTIRSSLPRSQPQVTLLSPFKTLTSTSDVTLTVIGGGFVSGAVVRINEQPLNSTFVSSRELTATLKASQLANPVRYVVDVQNPDGNVSNVNDFYVMKSVNVGTAPRAVAIDRERNLAVVTNTNGAGSDGTLGSVSIIDLNTFTEKFRITAGKSTQGVALSSLAGRAAVTNTDDDTVSIIDLDTGALRTTVSVAPSSGTSKPIGIAVHPGSGQVVVADSNASQLSFFDIASPSTPSTLTVDVGPSAPAIDPTRNIAAVAEGGSDKVVIVDLAAHQILSRITGTALPTGAMYDPDSDDFLVASSTTNNVYSFHVDPSKGVYSAPVGYSVGFNPTALDYNYRTSTLVTGNALSQTLSVMDYLSGKVKAVIPLSVSQQFGVAIDAATNRAVVVDQNNNRILIVPLPR